MRPYERDEADDFSKALDHPVSQGRPPTPLDEMNFEGMPDEYMTLPTTLHGGVDYRYRDYRSQIHISIDTLRNDNLKVRYAKIGNFFGISCGILFDRYQKQLKGTQRTGRPPILWDDELRLVQEFIQSEFLELGPLTCACTASEICEHFQKK
jgi:hypothetical protein